MQKNKYKKMEIFIIIEDAFVTQKDIKKLGAEAQGKGICFHRQKGRICQIIGYEREGVQYIEVQPNPLQDKTDKNIMFEYIIPDGIQSIMIGQYGICFHMPIL